MTLHETIKRVGDRALAAAHKMAGLSTARKNRILSSMAQTILAEREAIKAANALDLQAAKEAGLAAAMIDRLTLTDARIEAMAQGVREVAELADPVGKRLWRRQRPNGLLIEKRRVPLGVVAIIYESRPNVTADAAVLCLKAGNAVILRGGKEAVHSNRAIAQALARGGAAVGLPADAVQLIETTDRAAVRELVQLEGRVDVVIPRGGESLIRAVVEHARVPVLKHYKGVCHVYVDAAADFESAAAIVENAKCQRPGVCNAIETLLVHRSAAEKFLPLVDAVAKRRGVELRGDEAVHTWLPDSAVADEEDWYAEYLELVLAVKVVDSLDEAIAHINHYGSHHSDAIVSSSERNAKRFLREVDSATVYVNASTRFTDGGEFGMGAEMGISTDKLHARGPMGLEELTTYKYVITGKGQVR